jgi:hypothetical protein
MSFRVKNLSSLKIEVFISKYSGGDDNWYSIQPGATETWGRNGWELIAIKFPDQDRRGAYCKPVNVTVYGKDDIRFE